MALTAKQKREAREAANAAKAAGKAASGAPPDQRSQEQQQQALDAVEANNAAAMQRPDQVLSGNVDRPSSAGEKVTVACKLGVGWFDMQICEEKKVQENTQTGPREITQFFPLPRIVRIRGTAYPRGTPPEGFPEKPEMIDGYAITRGVDKEFFDTWMRQQAKSPYVINRMIFGFVGDDHVRGVAREQIGTLSGLEPIDVRKDGENGIRDKRVTKSSVAGVTSVETEAGRAAKMR